MTKVKTGKKAKLEQAVLNCFMRGDVNGAEVLIEKMLEQDEDNPVALALMADVFQMRGAFQEAMGMLALAIERAPNEKVYLQSFVSAAKKLSVSFSQHNELIFRTVARCVARRDIDSGALSQIWLSLLGAHPQLSALLSPAASFDDPKIAALAVHPFFTDGIASVIVRDQAFENLLATLRNTLRLDLTAKDPRWSRDEFLRLAASLSHYACGTEYIFAVTEEEARWVEETRQKLVQNPAGARAEDMAVFACYDLLGNLPCAHDLALRCDTDSVLKPVADLQIRDTQRRAKILKDIPAITSIEDSVSALVQQQYETFPYPRWVYLPFAVPIGRHERQLPQNARILVAGCGTGYEAALASMMLPKSEVLAIDLSRQSLSYAIARAEDRELKNVKFAQADILRMGERTERYDYILSGGVLHHMADPRAGWKVLRGLLKPRGLMRIGLYSEYARQDVVAARAVIAEKGFAATREGMNDFRRQMDTLLPADVCQSLRQRGDFYQLSMLCDLLFHVQEHRFTLPQLAETLSGLELEFLGFDVASPAHAAFQQMHGPSADSKDLQKWDALEKEKPQTFRGMYQFWCRAKT